MLTSIGLWADFSRDDNTKIVTDNSRGLEWQDDIDASSVSLNWQEAIDYCEALSLDGGGWRLANFNELYYIADRSTYNPAMDNTFQNVNTNDYWSSTTYADGTDSAWMVDFDYGVSSDNSKDDNGYVRCVRVKQ